jgi:hypothetical protein
VFQKFDVCICLSIVALHEVDINLDPINSLGHKVLHIDLGITFTRLVASNNFKGLRFSRLLAYYYSKLWNAIAS